MVKGRTVDEVREHDADGDHDLEETSDAATDVLRRTLGDIGGCDGRNGTDTDARNDTAAIDVAQPAATNAGNGLEDGTQSEDKGEPDEGPFSANTSWESVSVFGIDVLTH